MCTRGVLSAEHQCLNRQEYSLHVSAVTYLLFCALVFQLGTLFYTIVFRLLVHT